MPIVRRGGLAMPTQRDGVPSRYCKRRCTARWRDRRRLFDCRLAPSIRSAGAQPRCERGLARTAPFPTSAGRLQHLTTTIAGGSRAAASCGRSGPVAIRARFPFLRHFLDLAVYLPRHSPSSDLAPSSHAKRSYPLVGASRSMEGRVAAEALRSLPPSDRAPAVTQWRSRSWYRRAALLTSCSCRGAGLSRTMHAASTGTSSSVRDYRSAPVPVGSLCCAIMPSTLLHLIGRHRRHRSFGRYRLCFTCYASIDLGSLVGGVRCLPAHAPSGLHPETITKIWR